MSRDFPDWINPWTAAQGKRRFAGTVPLGRMKRLVPSLEQVEGAEAAFEAWLALDEERRPVIDLSVSADLTLLCQASLEPYTEHIERRSTLGVVESDGEIELLPPHYDPVFAEKGRIALAILVEDELILGLPQVPRNPALDAVRFSTAPGRGANTAGEAATASGETRGRAEETEGGGGRVEPADDAPGNDDTGRPNPFAVLKDKLGQSD